MYESVEYLEVSYSIMASVPCFKVVFRIEIFFTIKSIILYLETKDTE